MTDSRKVQLEAAVDASKARQGFGEVKEAAKDMAAGVGASAKQASAGVDAIGSGSEEAAQKMDRSTRSIVNSVQRATAAVQAGEKGSARYFETLASQRGANLDVLRPYLAQLDEAKRLQDAATGSLGAQAISAGQLKAALRGVPAQATDIATSLAAGQPVMQVLLQQGGQLKDMFGGIGPAASALGGYVMGMVNPFTLSAAAAGVLVLAYNQGANEAQEFRKQLILTGGAAGVTDGQLVAMARSVSDVVGTQGKASEVLASLVATGRVSSGVLQVASQSIIEMSRAAGVSVESLVKDFDELGRSPSQGLAKLNERMHFLTLGVYEQVTALEKEGRAQDAAALAQKAYAQAVADRAAEVHGNLGLLERAWAGVGDAAKGAWDKMLNVGRKDTLADQIKSLEERRDRFASGVAYTPGQSRQAVINQYNLEIGRLRTQMLTEQAAAASQAARATIDQAGIEAAKALDDQRRSFATKAEQMAEELRKYQRNIDAVRKANPASPLLDPAQIERDQAAIRDKYADKSGVKDAQREANEAARLLAQYRNLVGDLSGEQSGFSASFNDQVKTLALGWVKSGDSLEVYNQAFAALLARQPYAVDAARQQREAQKALTDEYDRQVDAAKKSAQTAQARVQALVDEEAALERARLLNITLAQAMEDVQIARLSDARASALQDGQDSRANAIQAEIEARKQLRAMLGSKGARDDADEAFKKFMSASVGTDFAAGFDKASASLGTFVTAFGKLVDLQDDYNKARKKQGMTVAQLAELESKNSRLQLSSYASLAGAAKGFFGEHTAGYKALLIAEQTLRAVELASSVQRIAAKMAEGTAAAAAGVANQASGDPYSAWARMAAMAAVMTGLGFAVSGAFGGGGGSFAKTNSGTGTVLGDSSAKSESIARSLDALRDVDTQALRYSGEMAAYLASIESQVGSMAALVVRSGITGGGLGVQVGMRSNDVGGALGIGARSAAFGLTAGLSELFGIGKSIEGLVGGLFGTKTAVKGQGISAGAQSVAQILASGFDASYYADVERKKKVLGLTTSTSKSTQYSDADPLLESQLSKVIGGYVAALTAAASPLGLALGDVQSRINGFVVDIGRIDLQGLSGTDVQERISAVLSAAGDRLAEKALGGYESFQKVGEGYLETIIRVGSGVESAATELDRLGVSVVALADLANKQGDVGAELVRQSLLVTEGASGVASILQALDGSASDIADVYTSLVDVRATLVALGLDADAVGPGLLNGAGGLSDLAAAVDEFSQGFTSSGDQATLKARVMAEQFGRLGLVMPQTAAGFVGLVHGIDTSTDAGQRLLGSVLGLSGGFSDLLQALTDVGGGIQAEIDRIKGMAAVAGSSSLADLQARFAITSAQARAGDQAAIDALPKLSQSLLEAAAKQATSALDLSALQAQTLASLEATLAIVKDPTARVPGYASGGDFGGGWRLVGESGPELEATGAARIFNASQTAAILSAGPAGDASAQLVAELRAVRAEVAQLRSDQAAQSLGLVLGVNRTATVLERVSPDNRSLSITTVTP